MGSLGRVGTLIVKALASILATLYVGWELHSRWDELKALWTFGLDDVAMICLFGSLALMPVNYGLEAQKWRIAVRPFYPALQVGQAIIAVFAGMASGIWTPNRIGEYAGRVVFLKEGSRFEAIVATFIDRICQLVVTLTAGLLALGVLAGTYGQDVLIALLGSPEALIIFIVMSIAMGVVLALFLISPRHLSRWIPTRWSAAAWIRKLKFALYHMPISSVMKVLGLSYLRYLVFSTQYLLLMIAFGYEGSLLLGYGIVSLVFLGKSVLPVMGVFELGVREWVAVMVMGVFGESSPMAVSSTLVLYLVNILLPTVIGIFALQRLKAL